MESRALVLFHVILRALERAVVPLAAFVFSVQPLSACQCPPGSSSICQSFSSSEVVFTEQVESIEPNIDLSDPSMLARVKAGISEEELDKLETDKSRESFLKLKEIYSELWPEPERSQLARSSTPEQLESTLEAIIARGKKARFRVSEVFRGPELKTVDVWTDFTCGDRFQEGEFYLVYASRTTDNRLEDGLCSPTKRLSDAGDDLVYLHFVKGERNAARLYGFVTSRATDLERARLWDRVTSPISDLVVQLHSDGPVRYAATDGSGRYVFDGLEEGKYNLVVFPKNYPEGAKPLHGPREVHVKAGGCTSELFFVEKGVSAQ